jgi:hypothetical protein
MGPQNSRNYSQNERRIAEEKIGTKRAKKVKIKNDDVAKVSYSKYER